MKRLLVILLLTVILFGFVGTLIARDPGYVLITYSGYTLQTSLWVLLGLLLFTTFAAVVLWRLYKIVVRSPALLKLWQQRRQTARIDRLHDKGVALLSEGEAGRARKFLDGVVNSDATSGIHYLEAARAADAAGDAEARETYLRKAEEADPSLARARAVVAAELALDRDDPDAALAALTNVKPNMRIARLRLRAIQMKDDWQDQLRYVAELRQLDSAQALKTEVSAALRGLAAEAGSNSRLTSLYQSLSEECRQNAQVIVAYTHGLTDKAVTEPVIRTSLKRRFDPTLMEVYGDLGESTVTTRMKALKGWLKKHADEPAVHYCHGCLLELSGELGLARDAFARSLELGGGSSARQRYGLLLAKDGQYEKSTEQLLLALEPDAMRLPVAS